MKQPKFYETAEFQALQAEWRVKLRESGFVDHEDTRERLTPAHCSLRDSQAITDGDHSRAASYYSRAQRWRWVRVWPSRHAARLWELHAEGVGVRLATVRCQPHVRNLKSYNERLLLAERALMAANIEHPEMGGSELDVGELPLHTEHLLAEGWDPAGTLGPADGFERLLNHGGK